LPVFTVGDATAETALSQGYRQVESANGDVHDLAALLRARAPPGLILNPCARETAADLSSILGARLIRWVVYETEPVTRLPFKALRVLIKAAVSGRLVGVTCQSPSSGRAISNLLAGERYAFLRAALLVFAASKACAGTFDPEEFAEIHISRFPREDALLKLVQNRLERQEALPPEQTKEPEQT
jgi:uroporphyrinogen-III synthase